MVTLADILRQHGPAYREKYGAKMLPSHWQAMRAIEQCRTQVLGGHVYRCPDCAHDDYRYHSCRNRHCPQCQHQTGQQWLEMQQALLLPVPTFLLTFTLPAALRPLACGNQRLLYDLLFRSAAAATQILAQDPRFVGGKIGMVGVLHTWGRNLSYHPHVHFLVPSGGWDSANQSWLPGKHNFFVPVKALSPIFRARFRDALRGSDLFGAVPTETWTDDWVVHCKPVGDGRAALRYLAPYIFRVAISNRRIIKLVEGQVTFRYRETDTGRWQTCQLSAEQFIHRFLQHVLPKGFVKVRYYGLFASCNRHRLTAIRQQMDEATTDPHRATVAPDTATSEPPSCPTCGRQMQLLKRVPRGVPPRPWHPP